MDENIRKALESVDQATTLLLEAQKQVVEILGVIQEHQKALIDLLPEPKKIEGKPIDPLLS